MNFLKKYSICFYVPIFAAIIFSSCSKDDESRVDKNLLLGQWLEVDKCQEQNYLVLVDNNTYAWRESGNRSCESNTHPTSESTGTYSIENNGIFFNMLDSEIIENPSGDPIETMLPRRIIKSEIINLTENYFEFELTYEREEPETYQTTKYQFEK